LLELTEDELQDMFATAAENEQEGTYNPKDAEIISLILQQIKKLKIVWFKHLKKLRLLDEFRDVL
jgi:hypothetical protein